MHVLLLLCESGLSQSHCLDFRRLVLQCVQTFMVYFLHNRRSSRVTNRVQGKYLEDRIIFSPKSEACLLERSSMKNINWVINAGVWGNYHIHVHTHTQTNILFTSLAKIQNSKVFLEHFIFPSELYGFKPCVLFFHYHLSQAFKNQRVGLSKMMAEAHLPQ